MKMILNIYMKLLLVKQRFNNCSLFQSSFHLINWYLTWTRPNNIVYSSDESDQPSKPRNTRHQSVLKNVYKILETHEFLRILKKPWNCMQHVSDISAFAAVSITVDEIVPGFRSIFKCTLPDSGKVELQHLSNYTGITGCIGLLGNLERGYDPVVNFSGLVGTDIVSLGANVAFDFPSRTISKLNAGLSLNTAFLVASLTMHDRFDTLKASCYHEVNPLTKTAIAAELKHSLSVKETGLTIGAQHSFFPQTLVKARLDTYGKVGALIQQGFWEKFFITMAGEVTFGATDSNNVPKVGVSVALRP